MQRHRGLESETQVLTAVKARQHGRQRQWLTNCLENSCPRDERGGFESFVFLQKVFAKEGDFLGNIEDYTRKRFKADLISRPYNLEKK